MEAMPRVHFTSHLRRHLDCPTMDVPGETVRDVLERLFQDNPRLRGYLLDDQRRLRKHVNLFVDGEAVRDRAGLSDPVAADGEIHVFQALSGG